MTSSPLTRVAVVGSGIIGLTSAICFAEAGFQVTIVTASLPDNTTSAAAGAIWGVYETEPWDRALHWARQTLSVLVRLASMDDTGVHLVSGLQASEDIVPQPIWKSDVESFVSCPADRLPPPYVSGWRFSVPIIDMPRYLSYLLDRFVSLGGKVELRDIERLPMKNSDFDLQVNCSGVHARSLVDDPSVFPARGQMVVVKNPGIEEFFVAKRGDNPEQLYILPHGDTVSLGGTFEIGSWDTTPDPTVAKQIIERCTAQFPALEGASIVEHRVGLRPCRPAIRLEVSGDDGSKLVLHNYGHGGSGVSLSWGCAQTAVNLAEDILGAQDRSRRGVHRC